MLHIVKMIKKCCPKDIENVSFSPLFLKFGISIHVPNQLIRVPVAHSKSTLYTFPILY